MGRFSHLETKDSVERPLDAPDGGTASGATPTQSSGISPLGADQPAGAATQRGRVVKPLDAPRGEEVPDFDAPTTVGLGQEAYYSGDWDKALRLYSRAIQLDPTLVQPWVGQVYCLLRKRQLAEAMTWVNRALDLFPEHASLLSMRGVVHAAQGMVQRAVGSSDYAMSRGATREAWLARGEILLVAGNTNAMACFDKAMELVPRNDWKTPAHIAMALVDNRKHGAALEYYKKATQNCPTNAWMWFQYGKCAERLKFYEQAVQAYETAHQLEPKSQVYIKAHDSLHSSGPITRLLRRLRGG